MRRARTRLAELLHQAAERVRPNPPGAATGTVDATRASMHLRAGLPAPQADSRLLTARRLRESTVAEQDRRLGEGLRVAAERERAENAKNLKIALARRAEQAQ